MDINNAKNYYWYIMHVNLMTPYEVKLLEDVLKDKQACRYIKVKRVKAMIHSYRLFSKT